MRDPLSELGHLRKLAKVDPTKRFDKLYRLVGARDILVIASERVSQNTGGTTAGIDGQTCKQINTEMLVTLADELRQDRYHPQAVRRAYIPKGKKGRRALGIPIWAVHYPSFQAKFGIPYVLLLVDREH
jgi:retron-type reverse transcriptase